MFLLLRRGKLHKLLCCVQLELLLCVLFGPRACRSNRVISSLLLGICVVMRLKCIRDQVQRVFHDVLVVRCHECEGHVGGVAAEIGALSVVFLHL